MCYILKTESLDIPLDKVLYHGSFVFCQKKQFPSVAILCRILSDEEYTDRAPDMLLCHNGVSERLSFTSDTFETAEAAFECVDMNAKRATEILNIADVSKESETNVTTESVPRVLCYDYLYNYFGGAVMDGRVINGASVSVSFSPLVNNEVVKFTCEPNIVVKTESRLSEMPVTREFWLSDIADISFDKDMLVKITIDEEMERLFLETYGWDTIQTQIESYELSYWENARHHSAIPFSVSKTVWESFIREHLDDFDISDNQHAQCPSYGWVDE